MAIYEYKCTNEKCSQFEIKKEVKIPIAEYCEEKLPLCEECKQKTSRNYTPNGHQTFGDYYKS